MLYQVIWTEGSKPLAWGFMFLWLGIMPYLLFAVYVSEPSVSSSVLVFVSIFLCFPRDSFLNRVWALQFLVIKQEHFGCGGKMREEKVVHNFIIRS